MAEQGMPLKMPEPKPKRRSPLVWASSLFLLAAVVGCGIWLWMYLGVVTTDKAVVDGRLYTIAPRISSSVIEVLAAQGQNVGQGQPLVRLDGAFYQRPGTQADAAPGVRPEPTPAETAERMARAQAMEEAAVQRVAALRRNEELARREMERQVTVHVQAQLDMRGMEARGASGGQIERARKKELQARESMEHSRAALEQSSRVRAAVEGELIRVREDVARARRAGQNAPAASSADSMLAGDPTVLKAPVSGRIVQQAAVAGESVRQGQPLVSMVSDDARNLWVLAYFSEKAAENLRPGQRCDIRPDASAKSVPGVVDAVFPPEKTPEHQGNPLIGGMRVPVRVRITAYEPDSMPPLTWGMTTSLAVHTRTIPWLERLTGGALPQS